jgi:hypothetical protein
MLFADLPTFYIIQLLNDINDLSDHCREKNESKKLFVLRKSINNFFDFSFKIFRALEQTRDIYSVSVF